MSTREIRTAELLVALFEEQIQAYESHWSKGRMQRRRERKEGRYDVSIDGRIGGLREGRAKWAARIEQLRKEETDNADTRNDG